MVRPEELLWLIHEQNVFFIKALKNLNHIFSKQKKSRRRKNLESFLYFSSCTGERLLGTKLFGLVILFYLLQRKLFTTFISVQQIIYSFSSICTVNVTNSPSLTAFESEFWRSPLLRECFSIST